jgi:hypothetical protein
VVICEAEKVMVDWEPDNPVTGILFRVNCMGKSIDIFGFAIQTDD